MTQAAEHDLDKTSGGRRARTAKDTLPPVGHIKQPTVVIERSRGLFHFDFRSVWEYRELLYFLVLRDIRVRYKQTLLGVAWTVLQPFLTMLIFLLIFGVLAKFPSDGLPYSIFAYPAILIWYYFSQAATAAAQSLVADASLLKKVYFPRLLIPLQQLSGRSWISPSRSSCC